jgi:hypothetical protein
VIFRTRAATPDAVTCTARVSPSRTARRSIQPKRSCRIRACGFQRSTTSGSWYTPATSGQGLIVEGNPISGAFFAAWYAYLPNGTAAGWLKVSPFCRCQSEE